MTCHVRSYANSCLALAILPFVLLPGAKVLRKLDVDLEIVAVAFKIAVGAEIDHLLY
jgi:hypothetical protein